MFQDFGLIQTRYTSELDKNQPSLEEKVTADAIQFGAEDVEIVDVTNAAVNVSLIWVLIYIKLCLI